MTEMKKYERSGYDYSRLEDADTENTLRSCTVRGLAAEREVYENIIVMIQAVRQGYDRLISMGRKDEFLPWMADDWGRKSSTAWAWVRASTVLERFEGYEKRFDLAALTRIAQSSELPGLDDQIIKRLERGEVVTFDVAIECVKHAKRNYPWPDGVCDKARDIFIRHHGTFTFVHDELEALAEYEDDTQIWLLESVIEGKQTLAQAVATGEVPESTVEDMCKEDNAKLEKFAKGLAVWFDQNVPRSRLFESAMVESARADILSAQMTIRTGKGQICPRCKGLEEKCKACNGLGRLNKLKWSQVQ
jgi:hypothetical protein